MNKYKKLIEKSTAEEISNNEYSFIIATKKIEDIFNKANLFVDIENNEEDKIKVIELIAGYRCYTASVLRALKKIKKEYLEIIEIINGNSKKH